MYWAMILLVVWLCSSCGCHSSLARHAASRETDSMVVVGRTNQTNRTHRTHLDSVVVRDSVVVMLKGDTVFCDRWHVRWHERVMRDSVVVDSIRTNRTFQTHRTERDSVAVVHEVKEVPRKVSLWERLARWLAVPGLAVVVLGGCKLVRWFRGLIRL